MTKIDITHVLRNGKVLTYNPADAAHALRTDGAPASLGPREKFLRDTRYMWRCNVGHDARQDELEHVEPRDKFLRDTRDMWRSA